MKTLLGDRVTTDFEEVRVVHEHYQNGISWNPDSTLRFVDKRFSDFEHRAVAAMPYQHRSMELPTVSMGYDTETGQPIMADFIAGDMIDPNVFLDYSDILGSSVFNNSDFLSNSPRFTDFAFARIVEIAIDEVALLLSVRHTPPIQTTCIEHISIPGTCEVDLHRCQGVVETIDGWMSRRQRQRE